MPPVDGTLHKEEQDGVAAVTRRTAGDAPSAADLDVVGQGGIMAAAPVAYAASASSGDDKPSETRRQQEEEQQEEDRVETAPPQPKQPQPRRRTPMRPQPPSPTRAERRSGNDDNSNSNSNANANAVVYETHERRTTTKITLSSTPAKGMGTKSAASESTTATTTTATAKGGIRRLGSSLIGNRRRQASGAPSAGGGGGGGGASTQPDIDVDVPEIPPPALCFASPSSPSSAAEVNKAARCSIHNTPPTLSPTSSWSSMPASTFAVRSKSYLDDGTKVASDRSLFRLLAVDVVVAPTKLVRNSVTLCEGERVQRALRRERDGAADGAGGGEGGGGDMPPFVFCVNLCFPPGAGGGGGSSFGSDSVHGSSNGASSDGGAADGAGGGGGADGGSKVVNGCASGSAGGSTNGSTNGRANGGTGSKGGRGGAAAAAGGGRFGRFGSSLSLSLSRSSSVDGADGGTGSSHSASSSANGFGGGGGGGGSSSTNGTAGGYPHLVAYYGIDDVSLIDGTSNTPESKLLHKFFFGDDDEYRDSTFKLLPRIASGNVLVKKAVGSKPAIMGRKLRQSYVRDPSGRFMEVIVDVNSSAVATKIVRLSLSYAKTLVVDMAFMLEGTEVEVLPERVLGTLRLKNVDFRNSLRTVVV